MKTAKQTLGSNNPNTRQGQRQTKSPIIAQLQWRLTYGSEAGIIIFSNRNFPLPCK